MARHEISAKSQAPQGVVGTVLACLIACLLLAGGLYLVKLGVATLEQRQANIRWRHSLPFFVSPLGFDDLETGARIMEGTDALYWSVGLLALGAMLCCWGLGSFRSVSLSPPDPVRKSSAGLLLAWLSFVSLLLAILCFFPPWMLGSLPVDAMALALLVTFLLAAKKRSAYLPQRVVPALVGLVFVTGYFGFTLLCASLAVGLGVAFLLVIHVLLLAPNLQKLIPEPAHSVIPEE